VSPVHPDDAFPLEDRFIEAHDLDHGEPVIIVRDRGGDGVTCRARLKIDDRGIARLGDRDKFEFRLPKGEYLFEVRPVGFCDHSGSTYEVEITDQPNVFRITFAGGSVVIRPHFSALETISDN